MLNNAASRLSLGLLLLSACTEAMKSSPDVTTSANGPYIARLQQAGAQCSGSIHDAARSSSGTRTMSSKLFGSRTLVQAGTGSYSPSQVVAIPYVEVPADGAEPGRTWRSCMAREGFPG